MDNHLRYNKIKFYISKIENLFILIIFKFIYLKNILIKFFKRFMIFIYNYYYKIQFSYLNFCLKYLFSINIKAAKSNAL